MNLSLRTRDEEWCKILCADPNIFAAALNPAQRQIGLKEITVQLARYAYQTSAIDQRDALSSHEKATAGSSPFTDLESQRFYDLQTYCNQILQQRGQSTLPVYQLTPTMIPNRSQLQVSKGTNEESIRPSHDPADAVSSLPASKRKAEKKKKKKKSFSKSKSTEEIDDDKNGIESSEDTLVKDSSAGRSSDSIVDQQQSSEQSNCHVDFPETQTRTFNNTQENKVDQGTASILSDINPNTETLRSLKGSHRVDQLRILINSSCDSLPRKYRENICKYLDRPVENWDNESFTFVQTVITMMVEGYEYAVNKINEHHEEKIQALNLRLFIQETSYEREREQLHQQIMNMNHTNHR